MGIISISLTPKLEKFIEDEVASGEFESGEHLINEALKKFEEEVIIERILKASAEAKSGMVLHGDLDELLKQVE